MTGRKTPMPLQSPCQYTKYCLRAFHCLNAFLIRQNCLHLTAMDFLCDFWFLRRRRADARQGEKDKKHLAHSMQSQAKRVCMEKEEGDCLVQLLPQGRSGTAQVSSDVVRRVCSCQLMVLIFINFSAGTLQAPARYRIYAPRLSQRAVRACGSPSRQMRTPSRRCARSGDRPRYRRRI